MYIPRYSKELQPPSQSCAKLGNTARSLRSSLPHGGALDQAAQRGGTGSCWAAFPKDTHTVEDLVASSSLDGTLDEAVMLSAG